MINAGFIYRYFLRSPWRYYARVKSRAFFAVTMGAALAACQSPIGGVTGGIVGDDGGGGASHLITASETPTVIHVPSVSLTSPSTGRMYTNGDTLPLAGKCEPLFTISLSGADFKR